MPTSPPPRAADAPEADVAVVGLGPVGATLAVLLAQRGWRVVAIERWPTPYPSPRAVHMDGEAARTFQACGLGVDLPAITEPAAVYEWRSAAGTPLLRLDTGGAGECGWPPSAMFHQPDLERSLRRRVDELGIDVRLGSTVVDVARGDAGVDVVVADGATVRARYVVGCDGADSTVRALVGVGMHDLGSFSDWLIVDVVPDRPRVWEPLNLQVCDPHRPTSAVSGGPGRRRWEFMRLPAEPVAELASPGRAWQLLAPWGVRPGDAAIERRAVYTFAARHARRWRSGRVLLAGDAAHQMPPFAGQGLCAGVRDAANLAWKLDLVLAGHAGENLLDAYQEERQPDVEASIAFSVELGEVICVADPDAAAARDEAMAAGVGDVPVPPPAAPAIDAGVIATGSPGAGHLLPQGVTGGRRTDDVHAGGWQLVTTTGVAPPGGGGWFAGMGGTVREVDADDAPLRAWLDGHGCVAALRRPDFRCFGTAADATGVDGLLDALRTCLGR